MSKALAMCIAITASAVRRVDRARAIPDDSTHELNEYLAHWHLAELGKSCTETCGNKVCNPAQMGRVNTTEALEYLLGKATVGANDGVTKAMTCESTRVASRGTQQPPMIHVDNSVCFVESVEGKFPDCDAHVGKKQRRLCYCEEVQDMVEDEEDGLCSDFIEGRNAVWTRRPGDSGKSYTHPGNRIILDSAKSADVNKALCRDVCRDEADCVSWTYYEGTNWPGDLQRACVRWTWERMEEEEAVRQTAKWGGENQYKASDSTKWMGSSHNGQEATSGRCLPINLRRLDA